jgi:LuxR family transcriptional regulator, maltose regulon positive regulatory protein
MAYRLTLVITSNGMSASALPTPSYVVALTPVHNDPERFCRVVAEALSPLIGLLSLDGLPLEEGVIELLNAVTGAVVEVPVDFAMVLWGYEVIDVPAIHEAVSMMVDYLPSEMHMVIVARRIPPLTNIPRLRARRQLLEVSL